jgi:hypothetical protein
LLAGAGSAAGAGAATGASTATGAATTGAATSAGAAVALGAASGALASSAGFSQPANNAKVNKPVATIILFFIVVSFYFKFCLCALYPNNFRVVLMLPH